MYPNSEVAASVTLCAREDQLMAPQRLIDAYHITSRDLNQLMPTVPCPLDIDSPMGDSDICCSLEALECL